MSRMIILVGIPGSGKSTYVAKNFNEPVINQDKLGSREKCLFWTEHYITTRQDIIIDRTNINKKQRKYFIELAKRHNVQVECIEFIAEPEQCVKRIMKRKNHPTINNMPESKIREIVNKFVKEYEVPNAVREGFSSHITFYVDNIIACERKEKYYSTFYRYWGRFKLATNKIACGIKSLARKVL